MQALALQQGCRHALIAESMLLLPLQEVYTSKDVKKLLVQLQSDVMGVVDKVGTGLPQRRALCQTDSVHALPAEAQECVPHHWHAAPAALPDTLWCMYLGARRCWAHQLLLRLRLLRSHIEQDGMVAHDDDPVLQARRSCKCIPKHGPAAAAPSVPHPPVLVCRSWPAGSHHPSAAAAHTFLGCREARHQSLLYSAPRAALLQ